MKIITLILTISSFLMSANIEIFNAKITPVPPVSKVASGFLTIKSNYDKDIKLIRVTSDFSKSSEIHHMIMKDSMMHMKKVDFFNIPAKSSVALKKGSYHLMFIGLNKAIKKNDIKKIKLFFDNGDIKEIKMKVSR